MKANEIQIGDWLYYKGHFNAFPFKVESITKKKVGYHAEPNEHRMHYLILSECKPIPLTPEILEKNGFINEDNYGKKYSCNDCLEGYHFYHTHDFYWIEDHFLLKMKYVHQLQQALRLCGINHEIIL